MNNDGEIEQYEVDLRSGLFILRKTDLFVSDSMPLSLTRGYRLWDNHSRSFGIGGNHPYDIFPYGDQFPYTYMELALGDGSTIHYDRISEGTSFSDFVAEHNGESARKFQRSRIKWSLDHWDLTFADGTIFRFPEAYHAPRGVDGALVDMRNPQGAEISFVRDARHNLKSIRSPHNHRIDFTFDDRDRVIEAADDMKDVMDYAYNEKGELVEVRQNGHIRWRYLYDSNGMTSVQDSGKRQIVQSQYWRGRVASITFEKAGTYHFDYLLTRSGTVAETRVTDPLGKQSMFRF